MQKLKRILFVAILLMPTILVGAYIYAFSPSFISTPIAPKDGQKILLTEPFVIEFETPIDTKYYKDNISLSPITPMKASINNEHTSITITPTKTWKADTKYTVTLPEGRAKNYRQIQEVTFNFVTVDYPRVIDITPQPGAKDVQLDIEDPITIQFDKSTKDFYIDFELEPAIPVTYKNNDKKTQFEILPQEELEPDTTYTLTLKAKVNGTDDATFVPIHTTTFTTLPPKPKTWAEKLEDRLEEARKFTEPIIKTGKYIDINLETQIMTIFENGQNIGTFLISSGKPGMDTPKGEHQIYNKHPRPWSSAYGLYMPYWMAITPSGKYGIHELPEWPGGYKEGQNHLGIKVSHGCVRLGVGPAEQVYNWAEIGIPVIVH